MAKSISFTIKFWRQNGPKDAGHFDSYEMKDIPAPNCADLEAVRMEAGKYLEVFRHCQHCRADSLGIPGKGEDLHEELYKDRKERAADTFSHG